MNMSPLKSELSDCRILVVGDVMLDKYWMGEVDRISPEAPVPVLLVKEIQDRLGGAANVALNVKIIGGQVTLLSMTGEDDPASRLTELLEEQGIRSLLSQDKRLQTTVKLRLIGRSQQLMRVDFEQTPDHEVLSQMQADFERELPLHDVVLFSDYGKGGLTHIKRMIEFARCHGKIVVVDPKGTDYSSYAGASVVTPNRSEMKLVTGAWKDESDLQQKAQTLRTEIGLEALLLTRSEEGMSLFQADHIEHAKAQVREVSDVTGAGDTVVATLALMLACRLTMSQAMRISNRAAGLVVAKFGTSTVSYEELFNEQIG